MLSILIIRMNLIFRVSLTLFTTNSLLDNIINPSKKRGWRSIENSDEQLKSEQSEDQTHWYSAIAFSKQKRMKLIKDNILEQMMSWFPTSEFENSRLILKSLVSLLLRKFYDCDETEKESKEDDDDINYDQVSSFVNSK